jgi:hypothetical protein
VGEQAQPSLRASAGGRCPEERKRQVLGPDGRGGDADLEELLRVGDADRRQASDVFDELLGRA